MTGSPTLLLNGTDPFATVTVAPSLSCRLYRGDQGQVVRIPSTDQLRTALTAATSPTAVLSAWRTRALPLDPAEKTTHQTILRTFATTGAPPTPEQLSTSTSGLPGGRRVGEVLGGLHGMDAIRLRGGGEIVVAYPFSALPTRHRVRIAGQVDVYAMCAIDALGIAPMLGRPTSIRSSDPTSGEAISMAMNGDETTWTPPTTVAFIGADAPGPSADTCCNYLNFFATPDAAKAWTAAHPEVPGQILTQSEALDLAARLFGHLLDP
ncbi:alkylmercury lyase family protein [Kribbella sp. NPDC026611]|uniref:alkylmercury lyase family protein n=1 Tax=Kribbella sp. NPDC026611 TaxID=3154911 RepID=UPI0033F0FDB1